MRHKRIFRRFKRDSEHREAMLNNLVASLFKHERITTTVAKAKDLRRVVEPVITAAAEDTLHSRRKAYSVISDKSLVHKLFSELGPRYKKRHGGYTRILKLGHRPGDSAPMALIELVDSPVVAKSLEEKAVAAE
jgi:large subunit ribosomal protein L17